MPEGLKRGDWVRFIPVGAASNTGLVIDEGMGKPRKVTVSWGVNNTAQYWDSDLELIKSNPRPNDNPKTDEVEDIEIVIQDLNTPDMREVVRYRAHDVEMENGGPVMVFLDAKGLPIAFHHLAPNHSAIPLTDG